MICVNCFEDRPLDIHVDGRCEQCRGEETPAIECDERATIRAKGNAVTPDDVRAYHLYGRPERDRSVADAAWLAGYESAAKPAPVADALPEFVDGVFVGDVGVRSEMVVTVLGVIELEPGDYGRRFLVRMQEQGGALVVWFTGEGLALDDGKTYRVKATVRAHDVYQGRRQTVVQRVSTLEEVNAPVRPE